MPLLSLSNISVRYGSRPILDGATFAMDPGEKVGLVGRNGTGKSTLMHVIRGNLAPDGGTMQVQRSARIGYLAQDPVFTPGETVRDAAEGAFADLHALHLELNKVFDGMGTAEGDSLERLLKKQARLESEIEAAGGYAIDHRIDAMLHGLGFTDDQFKLDVGALSGGQRGRLGLARLLLECPDLLLLDEPTNHLDIEGREWLETFLAEEYTGAVLLVSHDRWLLDRVVSRIIEVEAGVVREYPGNYNKYLELRKERQLTQARVREKQLDRIRSEEQFIAKYKAGQRAKQARGRQSRLERFKKNELVDQNIELQVMRLNLPDAPRSGDQVVVAEHLTKRYDAKTLFEDFDLKIYRGERIGIVGPNGVGKTTLVRCLLGDLEPSDGESRFGSRLSVGYYRQTQDHLDQSLTVWQYLQSVIVSLDGGVRASEQQARDLAGAFLFSGAEQEKPLADLSGGERSRAVLAGLVAGAHNLLVLDEPTNHLDIPSAERLESVLSRGGEYEGSLLLISHDRALLEATCDRLIVFRTGETMPAVFEGTWTDWRRREAERIAAQQLASREPKPAKGKAPPKKQLAEPAGPYARMTMANLEERIEALETRLGAIDASLGEPEVYGDAERCRELAEERTAVESELEGLETEWARRADAE